MKIVMLNQINTKRLMINNKRSENKNYVFSYTTFHNPLDD